MKSYKQRLYIVQNLYKFWTQNNSITQGEKASIVYYWHIGSISFFSSSDTHQSQHLLECHATGINSSFNSVLSALPF